MISSLRLRNFRSYEEASFEFEPGVNIVVGPNASGKTNLLEAVLVLSRGSSYRVKDTDLVGFGKDWVRLDGYFGSSERTLKLKKNETVVDKEFLIDGKNLKRLSLDKTVPSVLFEPDHLQLIARGPRQRRDFFDDLLQRSQVGFKTLLNSYARTLAQRNALLKQSQAYAREQLFAWDIRLSELGGKIVEHRLRLMQDINKNISDVYGDIAHRKSKISIDYQTPLKLDSYSTQLLSRLQASLQEDFRKGFTSYGPHREDYLMMLNSHAISMSASRGEVRSLLLALKIFELNLITKTRGKKPIFMLDDVFSELDSARRRALVAYLKNHQTIITTTDADAVINYFTSTCRLISVDGQHAG